MIPAVIEARVAAVRPHVEKLVDLLSDRFRGDLVGVEVVGISGRPKEAESVFAKLQTGKYESLDHLTDLAALTVVVLNTREVRKALEAVRSSGLPVVDEPMQSLPPTDLRYHQPKLLVQAPVGVVERNPELSGLVAEVQFTTALQHALDMMTHDFDYKGRTYSWTNFRLVAQLRGMLELVDGMIDDIERVVVPEHDPKVVSVDFAFAAATLDVLTERFSPESLPKDRRRLADTVSRWMRAMGLGPNDLAALLAVHDDLVQAHSLDPASAVLGALLRTDLPALLANFPGRLAISHELESLCQEATDVPNSQRVVLG